MRLTALSFCFAGPPPGWGCPCCGPLFALSPPFLLLCVFFFSSVRSFLPCAPSVSCFSWFPAPGALGHGALRCLFCWPRAAWLPVRSRLFGCLGLSVFSGPGCPGPWRWFLSAVPGFPCSVFFFLFFFLPPSSGSVLCLPGGRWLFPGGCCPPPPLSPCVSRLSWFPLGALVFSFFSSSVRPRCLFLSLVCGPWCLGPWRCVLFVFLGLPLPGSPFALASCVFPAWPLAAPWWLPPPPPSLLCLAGFFASVRCLGFFFFFFLCAPPLSLAFSGFRPRVPWASALCIVCFVDLPLLGSPCALASFMLFAWPLAAPCWLPAPPLCVSRFSSLPLGAVCRVLCCAVCPWVRCCAALLRVVPLGVVLSFAVLLCCAGLVPLLVAPCPLALPVALGPCALRCCIVRCSPALCAVCYVFFVVAWWCMLLFAALLCAVCVPGCCAVLSLFSLLGAVLRFAVLVRLGCAVRLVRAVAGPWCCGALLCVVLFPLVCRGAVLGLVARGCLLVACVHVSVPVWPRGLFPCGWRGLLWCPASLCRVLWCCAVAWCCAVVLCCRVVVLLGLALPSCGLSCCAVLCCPLAVLSFARWWCLRAVVLFPSCCAFPVFSALCAAVPHPALHPPGRGGHLPNGPPNPPPPRAAPPPPKPTPRRSPCPRPSRSPRPPPKGGPQPSPSPGPNPAPRRQLGPGPPRMSSTTSGPSRPRPEGSSAQRGAPPPSPTPPPPPSWRSAPRPKRGGPRPTTSQSPHPGPTDRSGVHQQRPRPPTGPR